MRSFLLALVVGLWSLLPAGAAAESQQVVVLVTTVGQRAWTAAELRLAAELRASGFRVVEAVQTNEADPELKRRASAFHAIASLQVLREGGVGVIRVWLERDAATPGGYRHVRVNLRNTEVVGQAVMPVVELVVARGEQQISRRAGDHPEVRAESKAKDEPGTKLKIDQVPPDPKRLGWPVVGQPIRYHVRSDMRYAVRAGFGPWFSGAQTSPAVSFSAGVRAHWFELWSLEPELFGHAFRHQSDTARGVLELDAFGARVHALLEPWPRSNVTFGIGPGVGFFWVTHIDPVGEAKLETSPLLSARAEFASALAPFVDVLFVISVGYATRELSSGSLLAAGQHMFRPSMDTLLAADWHWQ